MRCPLPMWTKPVRLRLLIACLLMAGSLLAGLLIEAAPVMAQGRIHPPGDFASSPLSLELPLAESMSPIRYVQLSVRMKDDESGRAGLVLDPNPPVFDESGNPSQGEEKLSLLVYECTVRFVKAVPNGSLYELRSPKLRSKLSFVVFEPDGIQGRLLVSSKDGEITHAVEIFQRIALFPPCHPGCFPPGTLVHTPEGEQPIEKIRVGDRVLTLDEAGAPAERQVTAVFTSHNWLLEVRTEAGRLTTTETQPVFLESGESPGAKELASGDRIWRWDGERKAATPVVEVTPAERFARVINLVLGEPAPFVAGGFVVRSKPPQEDRSGLVLP